MRVGVMTTDGGPHPAGKWAEETAGEIMSYVKIDEDSPSDSPEKLEDKRQARRNKLRLEVDIVDAVEPLHHDTIKSERDGLAKDDARLNSAPEPDSKTIEAAVEAVVAAAKKYGPIFGSAFDSDNGRSIVRNAIKTHAATAIHIERGWHADKKMASGDVTVPVKKFHDRRVGK